MRMELPKCNLKTCHFYFDGNCVSETKYKNCEYTFALEELNKLRPCVTELERAEYLDSLRPTTSIPPRTK